jgi:hypothetical protein
MQPPYPCPCCGYLTIDEPPASHDICRICSWEDDLSQLRFVTLGAGANRTSLLDAQRNFITSGISEPDRPDLHPGSVEGEVRDPHWRPLDPSRDSFEGFTVDVDDGMTYSPDPRAYWYWLPSDDRAEREAPH